MTMRLEGPVAARMIEQKPKEWREIQMDEETMDSLEAKKESWLLKGCLRSKRWAGKLKKKMKRKCSYKRPASLEVIWWRVREDQMILAD